jgi:hypothetical protein
MERAKDDVQVLSLSCTRLRSNLLGFTQELLGQMALISGTCSQENAESIAFNTRC